MIYLLPQKAASLWTAFRLAAFPSMGQILKKEIETLIFQHETKQK